MAVQAGEAYVVVRADLSTFGKEVETGVDKGAAKAQGKIKGFAKSAGGVLAAGMAANFAKDFLGASVSGARESIAIANQTAQAIKSTGGAANVTAEQVGELSSALSKQTAVDDELIQSGANLLLTFRNIKNAAGEGNDVFDQSVAIANDLAVALGTDMKSASLQVGKALNDPIKGVSALGRAGVQFTAQQKEQIKTLVESGDVLGAQKIILGELETQVGGSAAAQADGAKRMSIAWGNFQETIGALVIPIVDALLGVLTPLAQWAADNPKIIMVVAGVIGGALVLAFTAWAVSAATAAAATIAATWPVIAIGAAIAGLVVTALYVWSKWDEIWSWMRDKVTGTMSNISTWVSYWIDRIVGFVSGLRDRVTSAASSAFGGLLDAVKSVVRAIAIAWNKIDLTFKIPDIPGVPNRGERFDIIPDVPVPSFHTGGEFQAPRGQREGLALLLDGERVLSPSETDRYNAGGGVSLNFYDTGSDPGAVLNTFAWAMAGR